MKTNTILQIKLPPETIEEVREKLTTEKVPKPTKWHIQEYLREVLIKALKKVAKTNSQ